jgi:hypothetical protein
VRGAGRAVMRNLSLSSVSRNGMFLLCSRVSPEVAPLGCGALPTRCGSRMNPYSLYILHSAVMRVVHAVR